jgi:hypothetical protein
MMMEKCPSCGAELTPGANFCTRCGFQLDHPARAVHEEANTVTGASDKTVTPEATLAAGDADDATTHSANDTNAESVRPTVPGQDAEKAHSPLDSPTRGASGFGPTPPAAGAAGAIPTGAGMSYFDGGLLSWLGYRILGILVTVFTLGICLPWAYTMMYAWEAKHTVVNGHRLYFTGSAVGLFGHWLLWWFFTLITFGIYGFWVFIMLKKWRAKHTIFLF